jgi:hypothetical protein
MCPKGIDLLTLGNSHDIDSDVPAAARCTKERTRHSGGFGTGRDRCAKGT